MAKSYRVGPAARMVNRITSALVRRGRGPKLAHVLTVPGRRSRILRSNPVEGGRRSLVAPYGETNWVRNVRAAGTATLSRGGRDERVRLIELPPREGVPVLRMYLRRVAFARRYVDVTPESSDEELLAVARTRPVFRIEPLPLAGAPA